MQLQPMPRFLVPFIKTGLLFLAVSCSIVFIGQEAPVISEANQRIQRTTRIALLLPGGGQIANKKYWKAPIVWGTVGYCISAIQYNQVRLELYRNTIIAYSKGEDLPDPSLAGSVSNWRQMETFYQKNRDLSFLALLGVHLFSVLDAHVDANLLAFDVSENLSLHIAPMSTTSATTATLLSTVGLKFQWDIGQSKSKIHSNQQGFGATMVQPF